MTEHFAEVNGINVCYEINGDGEAIILIHGFGAKKEEWNGQIEALSKKFKVIHYDIRGAGKTERPNEPYSMDMFVEDLKGLIDHLELEKTHLAGWSMGGMILQNFVLKYPERVDKVILINTFPGFPNEQGLEMFKQGKIEQYEVLKTDPKKAFFDGARTSWTLKFRKMMEKDTKRVFHGIFSAEDLIKRDATDPARPEDVINQASAIAEHNTSDRLHEIKNKTLVLCADKDRLSPVSVSEILHEKIPNSILKIVEGAAHDSPLEKAPEVNKIMIEFLES